MDRVFGAEAEWLEADGLGGFASGTVSGVRTRRYHALLLAARTPPTDRMVLVNGVEAWVRPSGGVEEYPLCSHRYEPGVVHPTGFKWIESFTTDPWPTWVYKLDDRTRIRHEVFVPRGSAACVTTWAVLTPGRELELRVRPLLSVRDYHALHAENSSFSFHTDAADGRVRWRPYWGCPSIEARFSGTYEADPDWFRSFRYEAEARRGLDMHEDLASPGEFTFEIGGETEAALVLSTDTPGDGLPGGGATEVAEALRARERDRRATLGPGLARSAETYLVRRGLATTVLAGYPWFTDWGRDTFISMRGLCLATGLLAEACEILTEWSRAQVDGLLPNRFPDVGEAPEFHSVDAALWYVQSAHEFLEVARRKGFEVSDGDERIIRRACLRVVAAYAVGTRLGIRADADGLLACGERGSSLTWMDARVDGQPVTPRVGKPVEVQALWINALRLCAADDKKLGVLADKACASFAARFWNESAGCLRDCVDVDHRPGEVDESVRPNQLLAVGGLSHPVVTGERARTVVDLCERELVTPMGLRTLAPSDPDYVGTYIGDAAHRDNAYHNGTVWPWLLGPFVEAWVAVRGGTREAKAEARERFLRPLLESCAAHGLGHIAEIADGDPPHEPRGCPCQAWSVAEALRLDRVVLAD